MLLINNSEGLYRFNNFCLEVKLANRNRRYSWGNIPPVYTEAVNNTELTLVTNAN